MSARAGRDDRTLASASSNIIAANTVRLERERRWRRVEIDRLRLLTQLGALDRWDTDSRIAALEDEIAQLDARETTR